MHGISVLKKPSAWLPIVLSLAALGLILASIMIVGDPTTPPEDEGTAAHLFQLWLVLEAILIMFFAIKWMPQKPYETSFILAIQVLAVLAACFPVFYFHL